MPPRRSSLAVTLCLFTVLFAACQGPRPGGSEATAARPQLADPAFFHGLATDIPRWMSSGDIPGLSIAVLHGGELAWSGAFGVRELGGSTAVDAETLFPAASLSKPVFTYLVLRLVERGVLSLDTPLHTLLPYPRLEHDERYRAITAHHVLTHTAGLPNWGATPLEMIGAPGERFSYSGEGFVYLQKTVEKLTGRPLAELAAEEVFVPLGMSHTHFVLAPGLDVEVVTGVDEGGDLQRVPREEEANAAGSLLTTGEDYARFLSALLGGRGLRPATLAAMFERQVAADRENRPEAAGKIFWGLGWGLEAVGDPATDILWHWGDNGGFKAYVMVDRAHGDGLVYFANAIDGLSIAPDLVERVLGGEHPAFDWNRYERHDDPRRLASKSLLQAFRQGGSEAGLARYRELAASSPPVLDEALLNSTAYRLLHAADADAAVALFRLNVDNHPDSANAHDSLGEGLFHLGELEAAMASYRKALELNPDNDNASRYLAWIEEAVLAREEAVSLDSERLQRLVGDYGLVHLRLQDGALIAWTDQNPDRLYHLAVLNGELLQAVESPDLRLRIHRDETGRPTALTLEQVSGRTLELVRQGE